MIFDDIRIYDESVWTPKATHHFDEKEKSAVDRAEIRQGEFGLSVCFFMKQGGRGYIPLDNQSTASVGDMVNLDKCHVVILENKEGHTIKRVHLNK